MRAYNAELNKVSAVIEKLEKDLEFYTSNTNNADNKEE
jgi:hypothetical protein